MATTPNYDAAIRTGTIILNNGSGTTISAAVLTGAASGTRVREIRVMSGPTTAPGSGKLVIIKSDGSVDTVVDVVTLTNTVDSVVNVMRYDTLFLPSASWSIKVQMRTAITSGGTVHIDVEGQDK